MCEWAEGMRDGSLSPKRALNQKIDPLMVVEKVDGFTGWSHIYMLSDSWYRLSSSVLITSQEYK